MSYPTVEAAPPGGAGTAVSSAAESESLWGRMWAVVVRDALVNLLVVAALSIGFFHGWLKLRYRSPLTTFAYDLVLIVALVVVFLRTGSLRDFFPKGPTARALMAFYALCFAYLPFALLPGMPPLLVALSTLRGWIFGSLLYGLGYQIIRSRSQMHGFFLVILLLGVLTAIYGIRQSDAEVLQMMKEDPYFARRYRGQGYLDAEGDFHVRRFSTFISSGAFGATMATAMVMGTALFLAPRARLLERAVIGVSMIPMGYGMVLSGSRSAVITALVGCMTLLVFRRKLVPGLVILGIMAMGALLASQATGGGVLDRLATLNLANIFYRFWWPTYLGLDFMAGHPLGGGLGKTGFSPSFLRGASDYVDYLAPDGDLGRLMVEFGVLGVLLFGHLSWRAAQRMYQAVRATQDSDSGPLVLAAATNLWISIAFVGVGSPFVGIPMGVLVWFFVGAAERLQEIEAAGATGGALALAPPALATRGEGERLPSVPAAAVVPGTSRRRFLFDGPRSDERGAGSRVASEKPGASAEPMPPGSDAAAAASKVGRRERVFLYGPVRGRESPGGAGTRGKTGG